MAHSVLEHGLCLPLLLFSYIVDFIVKKQLSNRNVAQVAHLAKSARRPCIRIDFWFCSATNRFNAETLLSALLGLPTRGEKEIWYILLAEISREVLEEIKYIVSGRRDVLQSHPLVSTSPSNFTFD